MKKLVLVILQTVIVLVSFYLLSFAEDSARIVVQANSLYRQKKFDEAIKLYNEAQIKSPDSAEINYNLGIAWFKKEDYNSAIGFLEKATAAKDKILEAKANFNIANAKYKLGRLKENTDLKETVSLLRQSLDYYKRAIELDPKDQDAKINHELVEKELKMLLDKLKQEQDKQKDQSGKGKESQEQNQQQGQKEQQEKKEERQGQQQAAGGQQKQEEKEHQKDKQTGAEQEEKATNKQEQTNQSQEQQLQQETEQQKQDNQQEQEKQGAGQAEDSKEMSKEEANMLLEGYRQEENNAGLLKDDHKSAEERVLKDW